MLPRGDRQRRRKLWEKGEGWRERGGTCVPPSLSLSPSRSHATDRGEDRPKIRGYETQRRPNTRQRFARQKRDFLDPCLSIANPSHLAVLLSLSCTRPSHFSRLFAEFSNFPLSLSFSLSLSLVRVPAFLFPFDSYFLSLSLLSLSRIFLRIRSRGMNGNGRHVRTHVYGHVLCSIYSC